MWNSVSVMWVFDGFVCGCGTDIYCDGAEILHVAQTHETVMKLLLAAREWDIDILFESRKEVAFDLARPLRHPDARRQYEAFEERGYEMPEHLENPNFFCDKFVLWFEHPEQLAGFRTTSDRYFECIDRGGNFREFVPLGYSKATGLNYVLDYYQIDKKDAYAFGDSNNDLPMLTALTNSVAMGNASPATLFDKVSYVTKCASEDGIPPCAGTFRFYLKSAVIPHEHHSHHDGCEKLGCRERQPHAIDAECCGKKQRAADNADKSSHNRCHKRFPRTFCRA